MKMELPIFEKKMFRRSLVAVRDRGMNEDNIEDNINNESVDQEWKAYFKNNLKRPNFFPKM